MKNKELKIERNDDVTLHAYLDLPPNGEPDQYALFAHCFTCSGQIAALKNISRALTSHGFGVVRFDFTGLGKSTGDFSTSGFSANIKDLCEVSDFLGNHYKAPTLIVGHSLGGAAALVAAQKLENIKAVATVGAPASSTHVTHLFDDDLDKIKKDGSAEVNIGGRPFKLTKKFVDDLHDHDVLSNLKELKKPLLIMHSPQDDIVSIDNAAELYKNAFHPKSFVSLDGADHLLKSKKDGKYAGNVIGAWVERYLESSKEERKNPDTDGHHVAAHLQLEDKFTTQIAAGNNAIIADEPETEGGEDNGFSPYELLSAGLAACTSMTIKLYAERKEWKLDEVYVYVDHTKEKNEEGQKQDVFVKKLKFVGDLDDKQIERLTEIAGKCPTHKTLENSSVIRTKTAQ